jgi:hypothetical protein
VRNVLSGAAAVLTSVLQRPQLPRPSVGRSLIGPLLAAWRHTGVRFLLSGAAALQTSVLQQLQLPRPSVGRSLIGLLLAAWRHTRVRFLGCLAAAMLTSVPQRLQPARPSVGRLLTRSFFFLECGWTRAPCIVPGPAAVLSMLQQLRSHVPLHPDGRQSCVRAAVACAALRCLPFGAINLYGVATACIQAAHYQKPKLCV